MRGDFGIPFAYNFDGKFTSIIVKDLYPEPIRTTPLEYQAVIEKMKETKCDKIRRKFYTNTRKYIEQLCRAIKTQIKCTLCDGQSITISQFILDDKDPSFIGIPDGHSYLQRIEEENKLNLHNSGNLLQLIYSLKHTSLSTEDLDSHLWILNEYLLNLIRLYPGTRTGEYLKQEIKNRVYDKRHELADILCLRNVKVIDFLISLQINQFNLLTLKSHLKF